VTVTLAVTSGGGPLKGTTNLDIGTAAGNGSVAFSNLQIDSAGSKQLTASAGGLTSAVSSSFSVAPASLTITALGENVYEIDGSGIPGYTYRLQASDTSSPFTWLDLPGGSLTADATGKFQYQDTTAAPMRFYRTVYP
jgi:hypothetical protein